MELHFSDKNLAEAAATETPNIFCMWNKIRSAGAVNTVDFGLLWGFFYNQYKQQDYKDSKKKHEKKC